MEATLYNAKAQKTGTVALPENIFGLKWNPDLVHQVVVSMQANARRPWAHTKTRGEVRGGGRKPWRQKGTGRARHGSIRSPLWAHGGVTHGPRKERGFEKKINRKMREKALLTALSRKYQDGEIIFVDSLQMQEPKAKLAKEFLSAFDKAGFDVSKKNNAALIALPGAHPSTTKSFSNFRNVETISVGNLNPLAVLSSKYLIIADPKRALETLGSKRVLKQ
ncbi:MAG: 50S ribosomal protein L4 [Patescibacteria group bacterium]|nr:50S ribosomal protein L4 [Patescibacteria group bacterium]